MRFTGQYFIRAVTNLIEHRSIRVDFKDGFYGIFPYVWLRDCSLDPNTYTISETMKGRLHTMRDFDIGVKPIDYIFDETNNCIIVNWPGNIVSRFEHWWLKNRSIGNKQVAINRHRLYLDRKCVHLWNRQEIENRLQRFPHKAFMKDDKVLHDFLTAVCIYGIAVIEGADQSCGDIALREIVNRIGILNRNHFGEIFEVYPKMNASNMAYATSKELHYHTDFPSLQEPPNLQMLHMRKKAECGGGLSMFVDGFYIAELVGKKTRESCRLEYDKAVYSQMAKNHPALFQMLCSIPIEFIEEGFDTHKLLDGTEEHFDYKMVGRHKTFKLNEHGQVVRIQFGNVMRSWFIDIGVNDNEEQQENTSLRVQRLYDGLKIFTELCYLPQNQLIFPLNNGDTVLWANTRLLHARSEYTSRERHVVGCYFSWDIVKSRIRLIRDRLKLPEYQPTL